MQVVEELQNKNGEPLNVTVDNDTFNQLQNMVNQGHLKHLLASGIGLEF